MFDSISRWWNDLTTVAKHPVGSLEAINAPGDPRGLPTTAGGAIAATLAELTGSVSSEQELRIRLAQQEENARAQGPTVYGNFIRMKADLENIWARNNSGDADPYTGSISNKANETGLGPDLSNDPLKVVVLVVALVVAFALVRG